VAARVRPISPANARMPSASAAAAGGGQQPVRAPRVAGGAASRQRLREPPPRGRRPRHRAEVVVDPDGRAESTCAGLVPITKSAEWWRLAQGDRRRVLEDRSRHIAFVEREVDIRLRR
jgi:hypothetical protein